MARKYVERGPKTYQRFFIEQAWDKDHNETEARWDRLIRSKLDDTRSWQPRFTKTPTELSRWDVTLNKYMTFKQGSVSVAIGLYRDGFHVTVGSTTTAHLSTEHTFGMQEKVFGEINRYTGWTPTTEKVVPMANAIVEEIYEYFKSLK